MAEVIVKVPGKSSAVVDASDVEEVRTKLSTQGTNLEGYSASIDGEKVEDDETLSEGQAVVFTKDTKGGR